MDLYALRFFPLVFWMLGFLLWGILDDHLRRKDGVGARGEGEAFAAVWWGGSVFLFCVGLFT